MAYQITKDGRIVSTKDAQETREWVQNEKGEWVLEAVRESNEHLTRSYPDKKVFTMPIAEEKMNRFDRARRKSVQH